MMRVEVDRMLSYFPEVVLVWSEMIPHGARNAAAVKRARRAVNVRMALFISSWSGVVVRHKLLEGDNRRFMMGDDAHLNEQGTEIFLPGLQDGVEQALFLLGGGWSAV